MVNCPNCGNPQNDSTQYCGKCGSTLPKVQNQFSKLCLTGFFVSISAVAGLIILWFLINLYGNGYRVFLPGLILIFVSLTVSLVLSIAGLVSAKKNKKKGRAFGIAGLIVSAVAKAFYITVVLSATVIIGSFAALIANTKTEPTETTLNPEAIAIPGTPKIFGNAVRLPCSVGDFKAMGFNTNYDVSGVNEMYMWPSDGRDYYMHGPFFVCILDRDSYNDKENRATDNSVVLAITFQETCCVDFDFHGISFDTTEGVIFASFGEPAFERDISIEGHKSYYKGDNGLMYRFLYGYSNQRDDDKQKSYPILEIMIGSEDYMKTKSKYN